MIHVLHVVWGMEVGGKERFIDQVVRQLDPGEFRQTVWALRRKGAFFDALERDGFDVDFIGKRPGPDILTAMNLANRLRELRPDVIHVHEFTSAFAISQAVRGRPYPTVATLHGGHQGLNALKRTIYHRLLRQTQAVVPVSHHIETMLRRRPGSSVEICFIPYGIDPAPLRQPVDELAVRRELGLPEDAILLAFVARLDPPKEQELAIRAAERICREEPRTHLLLIGDGQRRVELGRQVKDLYLESNIHLLGTRQDVARLVAASDIGVLASRQEGLPLAIQEYMAAAKPVIATDAGGVRELVHDGVNGFVVNPRSADDFAERVLRLVRDPELRRHMGAAGSTRLDADYRTDVMLQRYADLYRQVAQHAGP